MSRIQKPGSGKCEVNTRVSERASERVTMDRNNGHNGNNDDFLVRLYFCVV